MTGESSSIVSSSEGIASLCAERRKKRTNRLAEHDVTYTVMITGSKLQTVNMGCNRIHKPKNPDTYDHVDIAACLPPSARPSLL
jgi:hypothetical protein